MFRLSTYVELFLLACYFGYPCNSGAVPPEEKHDLLLSTPADWNMQSFIIFIRCCFYYFYNPGLKMLRIYVSTILPSLSPSDYFHFLSLSTSNNRSANGRIHPAPQFFTIASLSLDWMLFFAKDHSLNSHITYALIHPRRMLFFFFLGDIFHAYFLKTEDLSHELLKKKLKTDKQSYTYMIAQSFCSYVIRINMIQITR